MSTPPTPTEARPPKKPLDSRDAQVSEKTRLILFPEADVAWKCHHCGLVYSNRASHAQNHPRCIA